MPMKQVINTRLSEEVITLGEIDLEASKRSIGSYLSISKSDVLTILCDTRDGYTWIRVSGNSLLLSGDYNFSFMTSAIKNKIESGATVYRFDNILELFSYILIHKHHSPH